MSFKKLVDSFKKIGGKEKAMVIGCFGACIALVIYAVVVLL